MPPNKTNNKISKNVILLGIVSFFNDVASEMIYPLVPIFLVSILGAPLSIVGLIEGIAESTSSIAKIFFGWWSDKLQKRKIFISIGYFLPAFAKILLSHAYTWPIVLIARFFDRFGKGVRTSPRDALIAENAETSNRGLAFGFHRALDTLGAVVGPLLALVALKYLDSDFYLIFFLSAIPAFVGVLILILFIKEKNKPQKNHFSLLGSWREFNSSFKYFLFISLVFTLGNSSDAFLILRTNNLGLTLPLTVLTYALFNFAYAAFAIPAGKLSDKIGQRKIIVAGFCLFGIVYLGFGLISSSTLLWFLFPFYGLYMALTEGVGKAYIANLVPTDRTGTAFGIYQTVIGLGTFFASFVAGLLWQHLGPRAPFVMGSIMAFVASILFVSWRKNRRF